MHLVISLPLQMAVMPRLDRPAVQVDETHADGGAAALSPRERTWFALLALILTISAGIGSSVIVHFMILLQAKGADLVLAVTLGTLFGPAQVGARVVERLAGSRYHPVWTMVASCGLMLVGLTMLQAGFPILALTVLIYGAGYGIMWIARGTLPLALFGPGRYATLIGRLAFPSLIVQALAPSAFALLIERQGADMTIVVLTAFAAVNVVLIGALWLSCRRG
jgi:hypothetical protein